MWDAILLDAYGTVFSTGGRSVEAARKILSQNGCQLDSQAWYAQWKQLHKEHMKENFQTEASIFQQDLEVLYQRYGIKGRPQKDVQFVLDTLYGRDCFEDAQEAVKALRRDCPVYIASNTDTEPLLENMARNHIETDGVFTSETLQAYKPALAFYQKILEAIQTKPGNTLFVGDSLIEDVWGPQQAGMPAVLLDRKSTFRPAENGIRPMQVIRSLSELVELEQPDRS